MEKLKSLKLRKEVFEKELKVIKEKIIKNERKKNNELKLKLEEFFKDVKGIEDISVDNFALDVSFTISTLKKENYYDDNLRIYARLLDVDGKMCKFSRNNKAIDAELSMSWFSSSFKENETENYLKYLSVVGDVSKIISNKKKRKELKSIIIATYIKFNNNDDLAKENEINIAISELKSEIKEVSDKMKINIFKVNDVITFYDDSYGFHISKKTRTKYVKVKKILNKTIQVEYKVAFSNILKIENIKKDKFVELYDSINNFKTKRIFNSNMETEGFYKFITARLNDNVIGKDSSKIEINEDEFMKINMNKTNS